MSPEELKAARNELALTADQFARILRLRGKHADHTVRRWESGDLPIPAYVEVIVELALKFPDAREHLKLSLIGNER